MCTSINVETPEGYVLARTMDFEAPLIYKGVHIPKGQRLFRDLEGNEVRARYRAIGIVFYESLPLKDGINEHGLIGSTNYYHYMNNHAVNPNPGKKNMTSLHYLNYALTHYKNVDELVEDIDNIHIAMKDKNGKKEICPNFHHMFTDPSGRTVVVEPKNKEYTIYENPYRVMTNSPSFDKHIKALKEEMDPDNLESYNGSKNLPGGFDPVSRFIKAYYFLKTEVKAKTQNQGLSAAYNIMDALSLPYGFIWSKADNHHIYTRYISAYDTKKLSMTARSFSNPRVYQADFDDFDPDELKFFEFNTEFTSDKFF